MLFCSSFSPLLGGDPSLVRRVRPSSHTTRHPIRPTRGNHQILIMHFICRRRGPSPASTCHRGPISWIHLSHLLWHQTPNTWPLEGPTGWPQALQGGLLRALQGGLRAHQVGLSPAQPWLKWAHWATSWTWSPIADASLSAASGRPQKAPISTYCGQIPGYPGLGIKIQKPGELRSGLAGSHHLWQEVCRGAALAGPVGTGYGGMV